jgi:cytochrome oxidase Cu insertion factor (SCO1/SenC/PrrC family)
LLGLLARSLLWLSVAALVAGGATWLLMRRRHQVVLRAHCTLLGPDNGPPEIPARTFLRISLGLLWMIDGLLQAQPDMPAGFVREMISPGVATSPSWLTTLVNPLAKVWTNHPVVADATTVWVQVGLGVLILLGGGGLLSKAVLWASVAWSIFVWVTGEFLGGLLMAGASWLAGSPGAVLVYLIASLLLLAPYPWWENGRAARLARRSAAVWILLASALQALPWEGSWSGDGLAATFVAGASTRQPAALRRPIAWLSSVTQSHPTEANALIVIILAAVGLALLLSQRREVVWVALGLCAATWWLAQDFGVLGGFGTDPGSALPLALLLASSLPRWGAASAESFQRRRRTSDGWTRTLREPVAAGVTTLGVGAALVAPLLLIGVLLGPAGAAAVAADSGGGVVAIPARIAPGFSLTDQNDKSVTSVGLRGKLTLVTFLDPVCSDDCPVIANQLAEADRELGPLAKHVEIVAIDSNPVFHHVSDVAAFTSSHGLSGLRNWHFVTGPVPTLQDLAAAYGIAVQVPTVGMIEHGEGIFFVGPAGREEAYLGDGANAALTTPYAQSVRNEVGRLLL